LPNLLYQKQRRRQPSLEGTLRNGAERTAPLLARVNKDADLALLRQIMDKPDLQLTFQSVGGVPNAPWQSAALYTDETGAKYC